MSLMKEYVKNGPAPGMRKLRLEITKNGLKTR